MEKYIKFNNEIYFFGISYSKSFLQSNGIIGNHSLNVSGCNFVLNIDSKEVSRSSVETFKNMVHGYF